MKITDIETVTVSAGWKNWPLLEVHTDSGMYGIGEGTLNGFIRTTEAAMRELEHLANGQDPRQSGGPVATAVCLRLAACVPNFLIQEHFDAFNEPWVRDLVSWHPTIDPGTGHLSLPDAPGLAIDVDMEVARAHPYDPRAYLNIYQDGWEKRLGQPPEVSRP